jgi:predicted O-methyltransferase YrrM
MFSVPLNPKLSENEFTDFLDFLKRNREVIYDFYFTCRMPPFIQDAMGDVFGGGEEDHSFLIETALFVQQETGIPASAVFNNLNVRPTQNNLDLFIANFGQLYEAGIRSATIPHTHWMATGLIKKNFPELFVKNTILRNVTEPRDVEKLAKAGFDYINLDRDLMRDHERLLRFKKAKEIFGVKLSILGNEGCLGGCIMMDEHYEFNNTRTTGPQYFMDPISRVSCPKWDFEDLAVPLKTANLPPWREDWVEMLEHLGIDVFKMHGRESVSRLQETMGIIDRFVANEPILFDTFNSYLEETNLLERPIDVWRKKIKTCKFDCWDCGYCDKIVKNKFREKIHPRVRLVTRALVESVDTNLDIDIAGLTSNRVQSLINYLARESAAYLEVGTFLGATAVAAAKDTTTNITCIDTWEEDIQPAELNDVLPSNSMHDAWMNISKHAGVGRLKFIKSKFQDVDIEEVGNPDLVFYDGPHSATDVADFVSRFSGIFSEGTILVFDDANWGDVKAGADDGLRRSGLSTLYRKQLLNEIESKQNWWNGLYIVVVGARIRP